MMSETKPKKFVQRFIQISFVCLINYSMLYLTWITIKKYGLYIYNNKYMRNRAEKSSALYPLQILQLLLLL